MSRSEPIEWNGQLVGHIEDIETETVTAILREGIETETLKLRTAKLRGRWVPLRNQVAHDFLRQCEEHYHVEVATGRDTVPGEKVLFTLDLGEKAWLLYGCDLEE